MHAAGSLNSAPATLEQWLARTLFINLCLLPMRPPTPPNEALNVGVDIDVDVDVVVSVGVDVGVGVGVDVAVGVG